MPDSPDFPTVSPAPFIALLAIGMLVGGIGHLYGSRTLVAIGVGMIALGVLILPIVVFVSVP